LRDEVYFPLGRAISTNETVLDILAESGVDNQEAATTGNFASAYSILLMAEHFCEVIISRGYLPEDLGSPITPAAAMAEAITRFDAAIAAAQDIGDTLVVHASRVGKARAHLWRGEYGPAIAAASLVPAEFEYIVPKVDNPSFRGRLGNTVWSFTEARASLVVPSWYRALEDDRIPYRLWTNASGQPIQSQGNAFDFYGQEKYPTWDAEIRLSSGLEARYIIAEAELVGNNNPAPALALIAEREDP